MPIGSSASSALGAMAGIRGAVAAAALDMGISSLRGSAVADVGLSRISFESRFASDFPPDEKRWMLKAETATSEPMSKATASSPFFDIAAR
ncbi:hypothetical protein ACVNIS_08645 [Sphaerotilaceae bacterium SBD11-9]